MIRLSLSFAPQAPRRGQPSPPEPEPPLPEPPIVQPDLPAAPQPDSFTATDGTALTAYTGESGLGWAEPDWPNLAEIHSGQLRSAAPASVWLARRGGADLTDQFAAAQMVMKSNALNVLNGVGLALHVTSPRTGYILMHTGRRWYLARQINNARVQLGATNARFSAGSLHQVRFQATTTAQGCRLQAWHEDSPIFDVLDLPEIALTGGAPGICAFGEGPDLVELASFDGGPL